MTYTVVHKDYHGSFYEAAAEMLRDAEVFDLDERRTEWGGYPMHGRSTNYHIESWEWMPEESTLRVWFR